MGVPERMIRRAVDNASNIVEVLLFADLRRCPIVRLLTSGIVEATDTIRLTFIAYNHTNGRPKQIANSTKCFVARKIFSHAILQLFSTAGVSIIDVTRELCAYMTVRSFSYPITNT